MFNYVANQLIRGILLMEDKNIVKAELVERATTLLAGKLAGLRPRTREIVLAYFDNPSLTQEELAKKCGCSQRWVNKILNAEQIVKLYRALGRRKIEKIIPQSVNVLDKLTQEKMILTDPGEARRAAEAVLRDTGVLGAPRIEITNRFTTMSVEDLRRYVGGDALPAPTFDTEIVHDDPSDERP